MLEGGVVGMKVCQLNPVNFSYRTMGVPWEIQTSGVWWGVSMDPTRGVF